jgi:hypothetical protein
MNPRGFRLGTTLLLLAGVGVLLWGVLSSEPKKRRKRRRGPRMKKRRDPRSGRRTVRIYDGKRYAQDSIHGTRKAAAARAEQIRKRPGRAARVEGGRIKGTTSSLWIVYAR